MTARISRVAYSQFTYPAHAHVKVQAAVAAQPERELLEEKLRLMLAGHPSFDAKKPWKTALHNLPQPPDEQV